MQRASLMDYVQSFYGPQQIVVSASGNVDHERFVRQVEKLFTDLPCKKPMQAPGKAAYKGGEIRTNRDLEQAHVILGFDGLSRLDDRFYTAQALSAILGGGMSSRLFQEIRENRGLVYTIYSFHSGYSDAGNFGIYAGTSPERLPEFIPAVCDEVLRASNDITQEELTRAKAQMKASLLMARESMMTRADQQAKYLLQRGELLDVEALRARIEAVSLDGVKDVAKHIFASKPTLAALGPLAKLDNYENIAKRLAA